MKKILIAIASVILLAGCSSQPTNTIVTKPVPQPDQCVKFTTITLQDLPINKIKHAKPGRSWGLVLNETKGVVYFGESFGKVNCENPVDGHYVCNDGETTTIINTKNMSWSFYINQNRKVGTEYISPIVYPTACPRT